MQFTHLSSQRTEIDIDCKVSREVSYFLFIPKNSAFEKPYIVLP